MSEVSVVKAKADAKIKADVWLKAIEAVSPLLDEFFFVWDQGITIMNLDKSHVAMVVTKTNPSAFECLAAASPPPKPVIVPTATLSEIAKRLGATNAASISLSLDLDEGTLKMGAQGRKKLSYSVPVATAADPLPKELKLPYSASLTIESDALAAVVKDASVVSPFINMTAEDGALHLSAEDRGSFESSFKKEDGSPLLAAAVKEKASATFSLNYLSKIARPISPFAVLEFSTNAPLHLVYKLDAATVEYWLAPRAEA